MFDGGAGRIQVAYDAAPAVILHEAAHAWFNGGFVADRWTVEGFASYYASKAGPTLKIKATLPALTPALLAKRFPLNAWASDSTPDTTPNPVADAYGLAAVREPREAHRRARHPGGPHDRVEGDRRRRDGRPAAGERHGRRAGSGRGDGPRLAVAARPRSRPGRART